MSYEDEDLEAQLQLEMEMEQENDMDYLAQMEAEMYGNGPASSKPKVSSHIFC